MVFSALRRVGFEPHEGRIRTREIRTRPSPFHSGDALKRKLEISGRFALTSVAAAMLALASPWASALGLGRLSVQSALGEAMQAEIEITSMTPEEQANLRIRVAPPEAYRAANVDYNPVLPTTRATLQKRADGRLFVRLVSDRGVQEPFVGSVAPREGERERETDGRGAPHGNSKAPSNMIVCADVPSGAKRRA